MDDAAFGTTTLDSHPRGGDVIAVLQAAVSAVDPYAAVRRYLRRSGTQLVVDSATYDLSRYAHIVVLAIGKAALPMARAALDLLEGYSVVGLVVPKAAAGTPDSAGALPVHPSSHPVPDERSLAAGDRILDVLHDVGEHDLVLVLLSGGGSALITAPADGLTLDDMRSLTGALLASGATINEVNALRRRIDRVKGGGLARAAYPADVAVLVLSDVIGDDLGSIASGPFVADTAAQLDAHAVVERYNLRAQLPAHMLRLLDGPPSAVAPRHFERVRHVIVGNLTAAAQGALEAAGARGLHTRLLTTTLQGEARSVGHELVRQLVESASSPRPLCWVAGGETTVTLHGDGLGGRNQELALGAVETLAGHDGLLLVALATDGGDGPTDAAGAVVSAQTLDRGRALGLDPETFLRHNDAYHYFEPLGDLIKPGPTETNVNDLVLLFAF